MNSKLLHENQQGNIEAWELVSIFFSRALIIIPSILQSERAYEYLVNFLHGML
jgi:hypothetical protein